MTVIQTESKSSLSAWTNERKEEVLLTREIVVAAQILSQGIHNQNYKIAVMIQEKGGSQIRNLQNDTFASSESY